MEISPNVYITILYAWYNVQNILFIFELLIVNQNLLISVFFLIVNNIFTTYKIS
jgi:hypothetical protein